MRNAYLVLALATVTLAACSPAPVLPPTPATEQPAAPAALGQAPSTAAASQQSGSSTAVQNLSSLTLLTASGGHPDGASLAITADQLLSGFKTLAVVNDIKDFRLILVPNGSSPLQIILPNDPQRGAVFNDLPTGPATFEVIAEDANGNNLDQLVNYTNPDGTLGPLPYAEQSPGVKSKTKVILQLSGYHATSKLCAQVKLVDTIAPDNKNNHDQLDVGVSAINGDVIYPQHQPVVYPTTAPPACQFGNPYNPGSSSCGMPYPNQYPNQYPNSNPHQYQPSYPSSYQGSYAYQPPHHYPNPYPTPYPTPMVCPTPVPTPTPTPSPVACGTPVNLGTAANFAILAGSTVTNTGATVVMGDLGLSPGTAVTGFPPGFLVPPSVMHIGDATAIQAKTDLAAAFTDAAGRTGATLLPGDIGGMTLVPGVYRAPSSLGITGTLVLDGRGCADGVWIFQIGSTLTTASASQIVLINGAKASNVFWEVGSSATLGTNSVFKGNVMASASVTVTTGVNVEGRTLAQTAAVTLDTDNIHKP